MQNPAILAVFDYPSEYCKDLRDATLSEWDAVERVPTMARLGGGREIGTDFNAEPGAGTK
jgi:hypothetical protein